MNQAVFRILVLGFLYTSYGCGAGQEDYDHPKHADATEEERAFHRDCLELVISDDTLKVFTENDGTMVANASVAIPVGRIVLSSTTQLAYFQAIGELDRIVGCPWTEFVDEEDVAERVASGQLQDVTKGAGLDLEKIIALAPDVMLYDPRDPGLVPRLTEAGIVCIPFCEYRDQDPVLRADWVRMVGLLCDKADETSELMSLLEDAYADEIVPMKEDAPKVLFGSFYQGVWSAAGGGSLVAQLIRDAGAVYAVVGEDTGSIDLSLEQLLVLLDDVDVIGIINHGELDRERFLELDPRLASSIGADKTLFYSNTEVSGYFDKGILEPAFMLKDLKEIILDHRDGAHYFRILK